MKTIKDKKHNNGIWTTCAIAAVALVAISYAPALTHHILYIMWLLPVTILLIVILPTRKLKLTPPSSCQPVRWRKRIAVIGFTQLALIGGYAGLCQVVGTILPSYSSIHPHLFAHTFTILMLHYGLIPWSGLTLLALGLAYITAVKKHDGYYSTLCSPLINKSQPGQFLADTINSGLQLSNQYALSSLIIIVSVIICYWLTNGLIPLVTGFKATPIIFMLVSCTLVKTRLVQRLLVQLNLKFNATLICYLIIGGLTLLLTAITVITLPFANSSLPHSHHLSHFTNTHWHSLWQLLSLCWWIMWAPLLAPIFARYCYGLSLFSAVVTLTLLPIAITLFMLLEHYQLIHWPLLISHLSQHDLMIPLIIIASLYLLALAFHRPNKSCTVLAYLPLPANQRHRSPLLTLKGVLLLSTLCLSVYLCLGPFFIAWLWLTYTIIPICVLLLVSVSLISQLIRERQR